MAENQSEQGRLAELRQTGECIGKLAKDEGAFTRTVEAFRAQNAEQFQGELSRVGILNCCALICKWLCCKECVRICRRLCGDGPKEPPSIAEMLDFAKVTEHLVADEALLKRFAQAVEQGDAAAFKSLISETKWERFCHQLCHFLCCERCGRACKQLCPGIPRITQVGLIVVSQIDAQGRAAGQSLPPGPTPFDDKVPPYPPHGYLGDHPFGGLTNIKGSFNVPNPLKYKVETAPTPLGPWSPILQPITDYNGCKGGPFVTYNRVPDALGWYNVSDMGCLGPDYLTDWPTPPDRNKLYYLRLTVHNAAGDFASPLVPARVDNGQPTKPVISLALQTPDGKRRKLGCCETVEQGDGNLVVITLQAQDENFSRIDVSLLGGCGASYAIVDTSGTPLSKAYLGNTADTGYPAPTEFLWDPWSAKISPCCYLIDVRIYDRVVANDYWGGGSANENWQSITIA
ncbi:MAG TPA: hypothetical protein VH639_19780 [Bryobacteraceae bacterium]